MDELFDVGFFYRITKVVQNKLSDATKLVVKSSLVRMTESYCSTTNEARKRD